MAERVGFEPTVRSHAQRFSRPPRSTTPAPLRSPSGFTISWPGAARTLQEGCFSRNWPELAFLEPLNPQNRANMRRFRAKAVDSSSGVRIFPSTVRAQPAVLVFGRPVMYAVIKTGGKQYRVAKDDVITVEHLPGEAGAAVTFDDVLLAGDKIGSPTVEGMTVRGKIVEQAHGDKVIVFKKKRRKDYKRTVGHRQDVTVVQITDIGAGTAKKAATTKAAAKKTTTKKVAAKKADDTAADEG